MRLFTRNNGKNGQKLKYNKKKTIEKSDFNPFLNTKFLVHGFGENCQGKIYKEEQLALLKVVRTVYSIFSYKKQC